LPASVVLTRAFWHPCRVHSAGTAMCHRFVVRAGISGRDVALVRSSRPTPALRRRSRLCLTFPVPGMIILSEARLRNGSFASGSKSVASFFTRGVGSFSPCRIGIGDVNDTPTTKFVAVPFTVSHELQLVEPAAEFVRDVVSFLGVHTLCDKPIAPIHTVDAQVGRL